MHVYGHGLDGAAAMRAENAKRKDYLNAQLKCSDCKTYKSLSQFLPVEKAKTLTANEFAMCCQYLAHSWVACQQKMSAVCVWGGRRGENGG